MGHSSHRCKRMCAIAAAKAVAETDRNRALWTTLVIARNTQTANRKVQNKYKNGGENTAI